MKNIIRKNFTQIPNNLINDCEISRDARFLFVYLCSKSDDWQFFNSKIEKDMGFSKNTRKKYMKELIDKGWITVVQTKTESGEWGSNEIELNITPAGNFTADQLLVDQKDGGPKIGPHTNTDLNTNTNKDIYIPAENQILTEREFIEIWSRARLHYDKKPTNITRLTVNESSNLKDLLKDYKKEDVERAIAGLFFQDTFPAVRTRPAHLLERQHFETYLDCWNNKTKIFTKEKKKKDNTGMI